MRWCRFEDHGTPRFGIIDGDQVKVVDGIPWGEHTVTAEARDYTSLTLLPPTIPSNFFCVGLNYKSHIEHAAATGNPVAKLPETPEIGYRSNNALIGHGGVVIAPSDLPDTLEAEPEAVAIIGKRIRYATPEQAKEAIFGWTLGNDVSARTWQRADRTFWRSKNADTFKPLGPWIDTDWDPAGATTILRINGKDVVSFATDNMIFDAIDYIVAITRYITMEPGDVLWMGADGVGPMAPGDTVDVDISGLGVLSNTVAAEQH